MFAKGRRNLVKFKCNDTQGGGQREREEGRREKRGKVGGGRATRGKLAGSLLQGYTGQHSFCKVPWS